jgi:hypothetical protein
MALHALRDVDRVFHRVAVGGAGTVGARVGIADHLAIFQRDQIGQAAAEHLGAPGLHLFGGGHFFLEGAQVVLHVVAVDGLHRGHVVRLGIEDFDGGAGKGREGG